jgi:hypothetical protein
LELSACPAQAGLASKTSTAGNSAKPAIRATRIRRGLPARLRLSGRDELLAKDGTSLAEG